jgi:hypothetical protein
MNIDLENPNEAPSINDELSSLEVANNYEIFETQQQDNLDGIQEINFDEN